MSDLCYIFYLKSHVLPSIYLSSYHKKKSTGEERTVWLDNAFVGIAVHALCGNQKRNFTEFSRPPLAHVDVEHNGSEYYSFSTMLKNLAALTVKTKVI